MLGWRKLVGAVFACGVILASSAVPVAAVEPGPSLGVVVAHLTPESAPFFSVADDSGALVIGIHPGGSAAQAGILPGDVIRYLGGRIVADPDALVAAARGQQVGAAIEIVLRRIGADRKIRLVVGNAAETAPADAATLNARYLEAAAAFEANDPARAVPLTRDLAMAGYGPAQNLYGVLISIGQAERGNPAAATFWFRLAAEQNESAAQNNLALQYWQAAGVPRDNARAFFWISRAAAAGNAGAAEFRPQVEAALSAAERRQADAWLSWSPSQAARPAPEPAPAAASAGPTRAEIRRAQQELARLGYDVGAADGVAGRKTKAAIRAFQEKAGMPVDGMVTPRLIAALAGAPAPAAAPPNAAPPPPGTASPPEEGLGELGFPSGDLEIDE